MEVNTLEKYNLTGLEVHWSHVDTSTFDKESRLKTGRITVRATRGGDTVTFTRYSTAEDDAIALAAKALDVLWES